MLSLLVGLHSRVLARMNREAGQALVEYALLLALIAVVAIAFIVIVGEDVTKIFKEIGEKL
jgi:Flp pilus assembly pilin Flp